jgi:hypothetical protein
VLEYWLGDLIDVAVVETLRAPFSISFIFMGFSLTSILFFSISSAAMMPGFFFCFIRFGMSRMTAVTTMRARRPATPPTAMTATILVERPPIFDIVIEGRWLALADVRLADAIGYDDDKRKMLELKTL